MNTRHYLTQSSKFLFYSLLIFALSCTDHDVPVNLPESECKAVDGSNRLYPCEFIIEKMAILAKDGSELGSFTGSMQTGTFSRFLAKTNTNPSSMPGELGAATFDIRLTIKRVANPSFPVNEGYLIGYTHNSAGKNILFTPAFPGDTYGERTKLGSPVTLDMAIGETRDLMIELLFPYQMTDIGSGMVVPIVFFNTTSIFIDNDVTTLEFNRTVYPYSRVGSVVEAYYEKLGIYLSN